jgi:hypothetical protein
VRPLLGLLILFVAVPAAAEPVVERDVVELSPAKGARIERLEIDNRLGDVRIEGHDRDSISIIAVKRAPDLETVERLKVSLIPDPNGPVSISTALLAGKESRPIAAGSVRIDLIVMAPRSAAVQARVWKGRIAIKGVDAGAELVAVDGDIDVEQVSGSVSTESNHGRHSFAQVFGAIDAHATEGDLDLDVVRGERLAAVVQKGGVVGKRIRVRDVSIRVTRGNVDLEGEAMAGGHYQIASYWGDVQVRLGRKVPLRLRAHARSGLVSLPGRFRRRDGADGVVTGYAGSGRSPADLDLRTRVGSITVAEF